MIHEHCWTDWREAVSYCADLVSGSTESKEDGTGVELFLPKMVLKFWNSSLYDLLAWILEEKRLFLHGPQSLWLPVSCFHQSVCVL